jgi:DnaJ like chaperone protein
LHYWVFSYFDDSFDALPNDVMKRITPRDDAFRQLSFTFTVIALSARLSCMDGPPSRAKYLAFREAFPLKGGMCNKIRGLFMLACDNPTPYEHYVTQIKYLFPRRMELFSSLIDRLFSIAAADGEVSRGQERMLASIARLLEISPAEYSRLHARHTSDLKAHEVLGLEKRTGKGALKSRYRELMRRWHPDRFAGNTLSPEVALLLKLKTSEINKAYRTLSKKAA